MPLPIRHPSIALRWLAAVSLCALAAGCAGPGSTRGQPSADLPPALRGNLLKNPGFEDSDQKILPWHIIVHADPESYSYTLVPEAAYSGARGIRLTRQANEPWGGLFQQLGYDNPNPSRLRFTAWVRGENIEEPAVLQIRYGLDFADDRASTVFIPVEQLESGWSMVAAELAIPAGPTGIEVTLLQYGPGHLLIDDLSLEVVRN